EDGELPDAYIAMGQTAENVAELRGVSRQAQDEYAVRSQNRAEAAQASGFFAREITPITLPDGTVVDTDDSPHAGVTYEAVAAPGPRPLSPPASSPARSPRSPSQTAPSRTPTTPRAPASPTRRSPRSTPCSAPRARSPPATAAP